MLYADAHLHTNPVKGLGGRVIAKRFKDCGGWFMALISLPPRHYGFNYSFEDYVKSVEILIRECRAIREEGIVVRCLAGIHPADLEKLITEKLLEYEEAYSLALRVLNYVGGLIKDGLLDGIGEVGRPHYKTIPEALVINELLLRYSLTLAKDLNTIIHLHLEQGGYITAVDVVDLINRINVSKDLILMHHLDIRTATEVERFNLIYTLPGKLQVIREGFKRLKPTYLIESDFIDDPKRPGVSSYPWDVVENQKALLKDGVVNEEYLYRLNVDNIVKYYRVDHP